MRYWHYLGRKVNVLCHFALWTGSFNTTLLQLGVTWRTASQSVCFNLLDIEAADWDIIRVGLGAVVDNSKKLFPSGSEPRNPARNLHNDFSYIRYTVN
jgi:hypothetical protein